MPFSLLVSCPTCTLTIYMIRETATNIGKLSDQKPAYWQHQQVLCVETHTAANYGYLDQ